MARDTSEWYTWTQQKRGAKRRFVKTSAYRWPTYNGAYEEVKKLRELWGDKYIYTVVKAEAPHSRSSE